MENRQIVTGKSQILSINTVWALIQTLGIFWNAEYQKARESLLKHMKKLWSHIPLNVWILSAAEGIVVGCNEQVHFRQNDKELQGWVEANFWKSCLSTKSALSSKNKSNISI